MLIRDFVLTPFQQITRVVACRVTHRAICIDPGEQSTELIDFIKSSDLELQAITLTHGHLDHIGGTADLSRAFPEAEIILHAEDEDLYYGLPQQPLFMGIQPHQMKALGFDYKDPPKLTRNWIDGELYEVGDLAFYVRHCPGHTRGHVVLVEEQNKRAFVGDCLFYGSIGRTDLPGGDHVQLMESIKRTLMSLADDFVVHSGHGPETTIGRERAHNPFLTGIYQPSRGRFL